MKSSRRSLAWIALGALLVVASGVALYFANDWWLSGVMTVSIGLWLTGLLAAIYSRAERRPAVIGAVLASFLYVLFALGPWFRVHVGPWLLTSQALVHVETRWLGRQPQAQQQLAFTAVGSPYSNYIASGSSAVLSLQALTGSTVTLVNAPGTTGSPFVVLGHWLCGWLAAGLGAIAALWLARRERNRAPCPNPEAES